jgi:hypothetical protein
MYVGKMKKTSVQALHANFSQPKQLLFDMPLDQQSGRSHKMSFTAFGGSCRYIFERSKKSVQNHLQIKNTVHGTKFKHYSDYALLLVHFQKLLPFVSFSFGSMF